MKETVDILLATYQGALYLKEQLTSIFNQTYPHFHLFVRDDGSTDGTQGIIKSFYELYPEKMTILPTRERLGIKANFSTLMKESKASYIMFCDQDDYWHSNKIEQSLSCLQLMENRHSQTTPLLVHTDLEVVNSQLGMIDPSFWSFTHLNPSLSELNRLLVQNVVTGCAMIINRALLEKAYPIPSHAVMHDWWIALVATTLGKIEFLPRSLIRYRQHGQNDTGAKKYSLFNFIRRKQASNYKDTTALTYRQAEELMHRFAGSLSPCQQDILEKYISLKELPFLRKKASLVKNSFLKQGFLRNLYWLTKL